MASTTEATIDQVLGCDVPDIRDPDPEISLTPTLGCSELKLYHPFQNHYTHEMINFEVFRDSSFRVLSNEFTRQLQFPFSCSRMQLQKIIPLRNFQ